MKKIRWLAAGSLLLTTACGTIVNGTTQPVCLTSTPSGARVYVDCNFIGCTPVNAKLSRSNDHMVQVEMDGYEPYLIQFERHLSGWAFGNIVFGGIGGLAVDAISGGLYKLTPEQSHIAFESPSLAKVETEEGLLVTVVDEVQEDWEQVGSIERL